MTTTRTRVSGFTTSRTVDDLSKVSEEMETSTMGSQHKVVTPIEVHEMMQNVFSDSGKGKNRVSL